MDIAISGLIVLILILPGTLFRKGYYSGEFSAQYMSNDFFSLLTSTLIPSILLYIVAYPIINILGYNYDLETVLRLFSLEESIINEGIIRLKKIESPIFFFHIVLNSFSFLLGLFSRWIIIEKSYDTKFSFFQFQNIWHFLITARYLQTKGFLRKDNPEDVDFTFI